MQLLVKQFSVSTKNTDTKYHDMFCFSLYIQFIDLTFFCVMLRYFYLDFTLFILTDSSNKQNNCKKSLFLK